MVHGRFDSTGLHNIADEMVMGWSIHVSIALQRLSGVKASPMISIKVF